MTQSTYSKQQDLTWLKGGTPAAAPTTLYFGLVNSSDTEVTSTYASARASLSASSAWSAISTSSGQRLMISVLDIDFGAAIAIGSIPKIGIYTALTGGNLLGILEIRNSLGVATPIAFGIGDDVIIASGNVTVSFSISGFTTYFLDIKLNYLKGTNYPTAPTNTYAAFGSLTRQAIAWSSNVTVGTDLQVSNTANLTFTNSGGSEVTASSILIYDALTSGNQIGSANFSEVAIAAGSFKICEVGALRLRV